MVGSGCRNLATGATNLIPKMVAAGLTQEPIIVNKLALADWVIIANVFNDWPFRPQVRSGLARLLRKKLIPFCRRCSTTCRGLRNRRRQELMYELKECRATTARESVLLPAFFRSRFSRSAPSLATRIDRFPLHRTYAVAPSLPHPLHRSLPRSACSGSRRQRTRSTEREGERLTSFANKLGPTRLLQDSKSSQVLPSQALSGTPRSLRQ